MSGLLVLFFICSRCRWVESQGEESLVAIPVMARIVEGVGDSSKLEVIGGDGIASLLDLLSMEVDGGWPRRGPKLGLGTG